MLINYSAKVQDTDFFSKIKNSVEDCFKGTPRVLVFKIFYIEAYLKMSPSNNAVRN